MRLLRVFEEHLEVVGRVVLGQDHHVSRSARVVLVEELLDHALDGGELERAGDDWSGY